ncbi:MAG TPA: MarR family transcriptional regulator [Ktedonobacterales bacterium]|nr:MarR family transcriptional regulator [Ktedonobacterales bacterium]
MVTERLTEELLTLGRILHPGRHAEMTPQQYWLLRHLQHHGPTSISELAKALGITAGTATVACQRLEKAAFVTRTRQAQDERVVQVALTEQGQALIQAWRTQRREALTHLLSVLDEDEQEELHGLIERLLIAAEAQEFAEQMVTLPGQLPANDERRSRG